jgi:hypothetical protein
MRINNKSARLIANNWLIKNGLEPIRPEASYIEFATELRRKTTKTVVLVPFLHRPDAVYYVRAFANRVA